MLPQLFWSQFCQLFICLFNDLSSFIGRLNWLAELNTNNIVIAIIFPCNKTKIFLKKESVVLSHYNLVTYLVYFFIFEFVCLFIHSVF